MIIITRVREELVRNMWRVRRVMEVEVDRHKPQQHSRATRARWGEEVMEEHHQHSREGIMVDYHRCTADIRAEDRFTTLATTEGSRHTIPPILGVESRLDHRPDRARIRMGIMHLDRPRGMLARHHCCILPLMAQRLKVRPGMRHHRCNTQRAMGHRHRLMRFHLLQDQVEGTHTPSQHQARTANHQGATPRAAAAHQATSTSADATPSRL